jgi:hypothetical protein
MTQALWRLLLICLIAAAGETVAYELGRYDDVTLVAAVLGAITYLLTQSEGRSRPGGGRRGEIKYWRGRRIDDDDPPRRLN